MRLTALLFLLLLHSHTSLCSTLLSVPLTLRHRENVTHLRLALSSVPNFDLFCRAHRVSAARCRFLSNYMHRHLEAFRATGPISSAATVRVRFRGGSTLTDLSVRHANESSEESSERLCTKYGVIDCTALEAALRAHRLFHKPVYSEIKLQVPHQQGLEWAIELHECESAHNVANLECRLAGLTDPRLCSTLQQLGDASMIDGCETEHEKRDEAVIELVSKYMGYADAVTAYRVQVLLHWLC